ncbi:MAG: hypothetical protein M1289_02525 [Patescibacteria group bacterium]|nr:hypothetical protein [Patescibacteria group bacterium]
MDGRVQEPVLRFGRKIFKAKYADTITEPGLVGLLPKEPVEGRLFESLKAKIEISLNKHHSRGVIVHGHRDCAGNPVNDEKHKKDILESARLIRLFVPQEIPVLPVFVRRIKEHWLAEEL